MESQRKDGRGHWPQGKRRHETKGIKKLISQVRSILRRRKGTTKKGMAREIGVDPHTIRRWLSGEDVPSEYNRRILTDWVVKNRTGS